MPVVGMIEPGARAVVRAAAGKKIGVIATEATVGSGAYRRAITNLVPDAEIVERACPLFVALAEEGWADSDVSRAVAKEYLEGLRGKDGVAALVLGCTHYPILRGVIRETVGDDVRLIDSGEAAAESVKALLESERLARDVCGGETLAEPDEPQRLHERTAHERELCDDLDHFYVTDAAERFARVAERFLGSVPRVLEAVEVWGHDELHTR